MQRRVHLLDSMEHLTADFKGNRDKMLHRIASGKELNLSSSSASTQSHDETRQSAGSSLPC